MIHLGTMHGVAEEDGKIRVEIPEVAVGFYCVVKVNPDDNFVAGDKLALSKISGSADEFYVVGRIDSTFGPLYISLANGTDLNTLMAQASYIAFSNTTAASLVNAPEAKAGILRVYRGDTATWLIQTYAVYSPGTGTGNFYSRGYSGVTWSPWRRVITSVDTFGPAGVWGTLDTALTTLDSRLDALEPRMTAAEGTIISHTSTIGSHTTSIGTLGTRATNLETRATNLEAADVSLDTRLDAWEAWQAATKKWSITLPSNWLTTGTSLADITGLTVTVPTVTGGEYVAFLTMCVELTGSATPTAFFEGTVNINGSDQTARAISRPGGSAAATASNRETISQVFFYDSATTGNKIFKGRALSDSTVYRVYDTHTSIKVIRLK